MDKSIFNIVPLSSRLTVFTRREGLFKSLGHDLSIAVRNFSGKVLLDPASPETGSLEMRVEPGSLTVTTSLSEEEKQEIQETMFQTVLEIERYPKIFFQSTLVKAQGAGTGRYQILLHGELSLHGVTREINIPAKIQWKNEILKAQGRFTLSQRKFAIKPFSALGGLLRIKDELELSFEILARR